MKNSKTNNKLLSVFLGALLISSMLAACFILPAIIPVQGSGESWLDGWDYRKSHVICNASGAGTNYQVKIVVCYGNGTDSGDTVYLDEFCQTDFDDIRFTSDNGTTLLDYWMETKTDSDNAVFWVEVTDDLSTSDSTIYVYYGNSNVTTTSSGADTFVQFDDFTGNSTTMSIYNENTLKIEIAHDTTNDVLKCTWKTNSSDPSVCSYAYWSPVSSGYAMRMNYYRATPDPDASKQYVMCFGEDYTEALPAFVDDDLAGHFVWSQGNSTYPASRGIDRAYNNGSELSSSVYNITLDSWNTYEVTWSSANVTTYWNDTYTWSSSNSSSVPDESLYPIVGGTRGANNATENFYAYWDWILIRKFVENEPTHGAWGTKEGNWLDGWSYRKNHTIVSNADAGVNYPIRIIVNYGSGSDYGENVYLNGSCQTDFDDIRFTDDDCVTLLDYWMETKTDSDNAVFWVEIADDLSSSNTTIYVYYGNDNATRADDPLALDIFQLREYDVWGTSGWDPNFAFSNYNDTALRVNSYSSGASPMGHGYIFIQAQRSYLDGKRLQINWRYYFSSAGSDRLGFVYVVDNAHLRTDTTGEFADNDGLLHPISDYTYDYALSLYGSGAGWSSWTNATSGVLDLSSFTSEYVTILIGGIDGWLSQTTDLDVDYLKVLDSDNSTLRTFDFTESVVMEQTGTLKDYGLYRKYVADYNPHGEWGPTNSPTGVSFPEDWQYRKSHTIVSNANASVNYPVRIVVNYGSGTDSGENVYLNGSCQTDFDDIRFTDNNVTLLDYWMETRTNGENATFWVEVADDLSSSNATIYVYYGNDNATRADDPLALDIFQLREYDVWGTSGWDPNFAFSNYNDSALRVDSYSSGVSSMGHGYIFIQAQRSFLDGKRLQINWRYYFSSAAVETAGFVYVVDNAHLRTDTTGEFADNDGLLHPISDYTYDYALSLSTSSAGWSSWTNATSGVLDLSSFTSEYVTILIGGIDGWIARGVGLDVDYLKVLDSDNSTLRTFDFTESVVMEQTGTLEDYGLYRNYVAGFDPNGEWGTEESA